MSDPLPPKSPLDLIREKRRHLARLASQSGAAGELIALASMDRWSSRPKGPALRQLLGALALDGIHIKASSFDAIATPGPLAFGDIDVLRAQLAQTVFIEIKTANQARVREGFAGFFFALTESEILAAEQLGDRHKVALYNNLTDELLITCVPDILMRSRSTNWQVSVQL
jgi:hypothetical protein